MTRWHAVVPIKPLAERKTRLEGSLSREAIATLTEQMLLHVLAVAAQVEAIGTVHLLSTERHGGWTGCWIFDPGGGLNAALAAAAAAVPDRMVILHADLPRLCSADVTALIAAAGSGSALAPDRRGRGTNGMALRHAIGFPFAFGPDSFARHRAALPDAVIVRRPGLALDIDLPEDLISQAAEARAPFPGRPG